MPYFGASSENAVRRRFTYLANASATSISGADANGQVLAFQDGSYVDVYLNGVKLKTGEDYDTATANTINNLSALSLNDEVEIIVYELFNVADTVSKTDGGQFDGNVTMAGTLAVTGNSTFSGEIITSTSGTSNFVAGVNAGNSIASGGANNAIFGDEAGTAFVVSGTIDKYGWVEFMETSYEIDGGEYTKCAASGTSSWSNPCNQWPYVRWRPGVKYHEARFRSEPFILQGNFFSAGGWRSGAVNGNYQITKQ